MREILFRAKSLDTGKWVYGYVVFDSKREHAHICHKKGINDMHMTAVDPNTVGQYTGKRDINKEKIFSGDAIQSESEKKYMSAYSRTKILHHIVEFKFCRFVATGYNGDLTIHPDLDNKSDYKIIGNIHDNPELKF